MKFKKCRNQHRRSSSVKKHTEMLTKTTHSATSRFKYVWSENAEVIFAVFRENAVRAKEIALWRYKDVLSDVELFHARTWAFAFP